MLAAVTPTIPIPFPIPRPPTRVAVLLLHQGSWRRRRGVPRRPPLEMPLIITAVVIHSRSSDDSTTTFSWSRSCLVLFMLPIREAGWPVTRWAGTGSGHIGRRELSFLRSRAVGREANAGEDAGLMLLVSGRGKLRCCSRWFRRGFRAAMVAAAAVVMVIPVAVGFFFFVILAAAVVIILVIVGLLLGRRTGELWVPRAPVRGMTVATWKVMVGARRRGRQLLNRTTHSIRWGRTILGHNWAQLCFKPTQIQISMHFS